MGESTLTFDQTGAFAANFVNGSSSLQFDSTGTNANSLTFHSDNATLPVPESN